MTIPLITVAAEDDGAIGAAFASLPEHPIACNNWSRDYPYAPRVTFRMFHNGPCLMLRYDVAEECTKAEVAEDHGEVWTDSCAEFFIAPGGEGYYNFETNAAGRMLAAWRRSRTEALPAPAEVMQSIARSSSLGSEPFAERRGDMRWSLTLKIPAGALFRHGLTGWSGLHARMNLYKCGDGLSQPHFLSWQPIDTPQPNFHMPQFFGEVEFAAK